MQVFNKVMSELLYLKLADQLAGMIHLGLFRAGDRIPSVRQASKQHQVSVPTVLQAYTLLEGRDCPAVSLYVRMDEASLEVKASETRLERVPIAANLRHDQLDTHLTEDLLEDPAQPADGLPAPVARLGVPESLQIIALAPASFAEAPSPYRPLIPPEQLGVVAEIAYGSASPQAQARVLRGHAAMASFAKGAGEVFNAGTTEWAHGLAARDPFVTRITRNVMDRFLAAATAR